jgi:hypothetical protein
MAASFRKTARCPLTGLKEGQTDCRGSGGLLPFPRTGGALCTEERIRNDQIRNKELFVSENVEVSTDLCEMTALVNVPALRPCPQRSIRCHFAEIQSDT